MCMSILGERVKKFAVILLDNCWRTKKVAHLLFVLYGTENESRLSLLCL